VCRLGVRKWVLRVSGRDRGRKTDDACGRDDSDDSDGWMKRKGRKWPWFHSTFEIIGAIEAGKFPDRVIPVNSLR
jgi:hypothetical protein